MLVTLHSRLYKIISNQPLRCYQYDCTNQAIKLLKDLLIVQVSLDCPCLIAPSVFSNVYLLKIVIKTPQPYKAPQSYKAP